MRLNKKNKFSFVGPVSCVALLALVMLGMACPETNGAFATRADENDTTTSNSENGTFGFTVEDPSKTDTASNSQDGSFGFTVDQNGDATSNSESSNFGFTVDQNSDTTSNSVDTNVRFDVKEYIQLTTTGNNFDVTMNVDVPTENGTFTSASKEFNVQANGASGFDVFVFANDEASRSLTGSEGNDAKIAPLASSVSADVASTSAFTANSWGYDVTTKNTNAQTYRPISVGASEAAYSSNKAAGVDLKLTCGTKVDTSLPADTYSTSVTVSAVAPAGTVSHVNN